MKAMVRDDIIALETFVVLRFKYEKYIEMLYDCGGYCFVDQFIKFFGGENKGRYLVEQLEKNGLIKTKFFNNYKYCYLTDASIKYVKYKDDPRDFSKMKKADIPVKKISSNPTDKVLFSSALKFSLMQRMDICGKRKFIKQCTDTFSLVYKNQPQKEELLKNAVKKTIDYYDKSKIIFIISSERAMLQMIILDTGITKSINNYINLLKEYLKAIHIKFKDIVIVPFSHSREESERIGAEFNKKLEERHTLINQYKEMYSETPLFLEKELEKIDKIIPGFTCGYIKEGIYIGNYKDRILQSTNYIKPKDLDRFEALREKFKNKE